MQAIHDIHDKGYKRLFRNRTIFRQLLETFVRQPWVKDLDFDQCETIDKSFVSDEYKDTESDLIYKAKLKGKDIYIVILLEFQSSVYRFMALRVLDYITDFYLDYVRSHKRVKRLPPVFPIVLYNGKKSWTAPTNLADLIAHNEILGKFALHFEYFPIVERAFTKRELLAIQNIVSTLFLTETHYDLDALKPEFLKLFREERDRHAVSLFLNWFKQLSRQGRITEADYDTLEDHLYQHEEEVAMLVEEIRKEKKHLYEQGFQQGRLEGKLEGKSEGKSEGKLEDAKVMLLKGLSVPLIVEITGLPRETIEKLQQASLMQSSNN